MEQYSEKKQILIADVCLLFAAMFWGGGFIAADIAVVHFTPFYLIAMRFCLASVLIYFLFRRHVHHAGKGELVGGVVIGSIMFFMLPFQVIALRYTTPSKQAFILAMYVAIVPLLSWLVSKKKPSLQTLVSGLIVIFGVGIIALTDTFTIALGDALSLVGAFAYALVVVATGYFVTKHNPFAISFYSYLTTGVLALVFALLFEEMPTAFPKEGVLGVLYLAIINTTVAYTLQNFAQKYTSDSHAAILVSTESVFAFVFSIMLFGEAFTWRVLIGGLVVFVGVILSQLKIGKKTS
ncbi:DMT family transporter [Chakrabartyella piscis]|uniref:DMT family transporter n=1 Tax=Chakrabartyella piscis TaxID=2918914 RepID=UPI002958C1A0|nr:DMT family transporter [Chakrabartyella piscis]